MHNFLNGLAAEIMRHDLKNTLILLPNLRSGVEMRKILVEKLPNGGFLPKIDTLNKWAIEASELDQADSVELKFWLYDIYRSEMGPNAHSISQFFGWADLLISDFSDIDNYLIEPGNIFRNLSQYTEIEAFSFLTEPLSTKQVDYARFWEKLPILYQHLRTKQLLEGRGYSGLIMKEALRALKSGETKLPKNIVIGGFNALTKSEFEVCHHLQEHFGAHVFFELDPAFQREQKERAAYFVKKNTDQGLGSILPSSRSIAISPIAIEIWEAAHSMEEPLVLNTLLCNLSPAELSQTAVVLSDENMLMPILSALPPIDLKPNITMGISLSGGILETWIRQFCELESSREKNRTELTKIAVNKFLQETLSNILWEHDYESLSQQLSGTFDAELAQKDRLYSLLRDSTPLIEKLTKLLSWLETKVEGLQLNNLDKLKLQHGVKAMEASLNDLKSFADSRLLDISSIQAIVLNSLKNEKISIVSNPDENLQITGLLETRSLSYQRLIFLSADESFLPAKSGNESFIPFEIRQAYGLPGRREKEAVYAYYFFRLIGAAKAVNLVYYSSDSNLRGNEKSRYIYQLEYHWAKVNPQMQISYHALDNYIPYSEAEERQIEKTEAVIESIQKYLSRGVSASSLNAYLADPVEWYYTYVIKLKIPDKQVDFDNSTYGTLFHKVLELMYEPYVGKVLDDQNIKAINNRFPALIQEVFENHFPNRNLEVGEIRLRIEQLNQTIKKMLKQEMFLPEQNQFPILRGVELALDTQLNLEISGNTISVLVKGNIDRLQTNGSNCEIIDYKTGGVEKNDLTLNNEIDLNSVKKKGKAIQLLIYEYLVSTNLPKLNLGTLTTYTYQGRIIATTRPSVQDFVLQFDGEDRNTYFEALLTAIVREMLDATTPLCRPADAKYSQFDT